MPDIFISYSSKDKDLVAPIRTALVRLGFDAFWDQVLPPGIDWDSWIRRNLSESKCAIVLWTNYSIASDNVRHEATLAKQQGKLIPVVLEVIPPEAFPMGLYSVQAHNMVGWDGNTDNLNWKPLLNEIMQRVTPLWVKSFAEQLQAENAEQRTRAEACEQRNAALQKQLQTEMNNHAELQADHDRIAALLTVANVQLAEIRLNQPSLDAQARYLLRQTQKDQERIVQESNVTDVPSLMKPPSRGVSLGRLIAISPLVVLVYMIMFWFVFHILQSLFPQLVKTKIDIQIYSPHSAADFRVFQKGAR